MIIIKFSIVTSMQYRYHRNSIQGYFMYIDEDIPMIGAVNTLHLEYGVLERVSESSSYKVIETFYISGILIYQ